jgi:glycosyltransferase involved in cell wall biosynthesis
MKTILIIEDSSKYGFGGGQQVTLRVIEALINDYNIILADTYPNSFFSKKAITNVNSFIKLYNFNYFSKRNISSFYFIEVLIFPLLSVLNVIKLLIFIKINNFNRLNCIIYSPHKKSLIFSCILNFLIKIKYIYHAHTYDSPKSLFFKFISYAFKKAEKIICVSEFIENNIGLDNAIVIRNPVKINNELRPKLLKEKIIVASVSVLEKFKGIDYFVESYSKLKNSSKVTYNIYGEGPYKQRLTDKCNNNIVLKGFCNNISYELKNNIDLLVFPSIIPESFGMVIIEAISYGIPVIVTDLGGQSELVRDKNVGKLIPIKNSIAIAKAIDHYIENPNLYIHHSKEALNYIKNFSYEKFQKVIIELFSKLF